MAGSTCLMITISRFSFPRTPREQAGGSGRQSDSGEAILQYVPKALSAEPQ